MKKGFIAFLTTLLVSSTNLAFPAQQNQTQKQIRKQSPRQHKEQHSEPSPEQFPKPLPKPFPKSFKETAPSATNLPQVKTETISEKLDHLTAGDVVELRVYPPDESKTDALPEIADKLKEGPVDWGNGRILSWQPYDSEKGYISLKLTSYSPGPFEIKPIVFHKNGSSVFQTETQTLDYKQIQADPKEANDIFPPETIGYPYWILLVSGILGGLLLAFIIWWCLRYFRKRKRVVSKNIPPELQLTPFERFQKKCAAIENNRHVEKQEFKPHYFSLSEATKQYIGGAFGFDAEEKTTRELMSELEKQSLGSELLGLWEKLFEHMDLIKFTDQLPQLDQAKQLSAQLLKAARETDKQRKSSNLLDSQSTEPSHEL